jgi:outer membrane protein, heavy metal efflux system
MNWKTKLTVLLLALMAGGAQISARAEDPNAGPPPVRMADLVREALERNPEIKMARHNVDARRARISQAKAWPDPTVTLGYGGNIMPPYTLMRGDPSSQRQFMAEQMIPYPGKTHLRGEIASREADAEATMVEESSRRVAAEVKQAYFDLYYTDRALATLALDRQVLQRIAKVAEIRYSVGKGAQPDVIRAQLEVTRLAERQTMLEQTRRTLEAQINSLRDLPPDTPIGPVEAIQQTTLAQSVEELQSAAAASLPALDRQRKLIESNQLAVELARKEVRPDFSVGYTYMQRADLPDMYGFTFTTSLPIFRKSKQEPAIREAAYNLEAARRGEANALTMVRYRVKQDFLEAEAAARLLDLYKQALVPQSKLALESSVAGYETGATDFQSVLMNFTTILEYELNVHQQLAAHEKALARLEEMTGLELIK